VAAGRSEEEIVSSLYASQRPVATKAACAFCGESRDSSLQYARMHNLTIAAKSSTKDKDKEDDDKSSTSSNGPGMVSAGYPLCQYCLNRVRSVCDFVVFMRAVRDGVWKIDDSSSEQKAWDECVRLKERMFWARTGAIFPFDDTDESYEESMYVLSSQHPSDSLSQVQDKDVTGTAVDGSTNNNGAVDVSEQRVDDPANGIKAVEADTVETGGKSVNGGTGDLTATATPLLNNDEVLPLASLTPLGSGKLPADWGTPNSDVQIHDIHVAEAQPITVVQAEQIRQSFSSNEDDEDEFLDSYADEDNHSVGEGFVGSAAS
jgi:hypothetical protein